MVYPPSLISDIKIRPFGPSRILIFSSFLALNQNIDVKVIPYTLKRCNYSSGNVYRQGQKLIINLTVKINTSINSYDTIIEGLPDIRTNLAVLSFFNATKGTQVTSAICQNGTVKLIGPMPSVNDGIAITGECFIKTQ